MSRPSWDEYFIRIAKLVASRSNCLSRHVGAVIVKDKMIVSTGYNGTPRGIKNCDEGGCKRCSDRKEGKIKSGEKLDECVCVHAEENALLQAAYNGVSVKNAVIYTSLCPCRYCTKHIINAGIKRVYYSSEYNLDEISKKLFEEAGVELVQYKD
ncbi:dCMP deaminase family protein [Candidatus Woesearchaeota archaeon]|nr:dCMP deaminase family protein [Candidatus Woesearchaeota archaeon]